MCQDVEAAEVTACVAALQTKEEDEVKACVAAYLNDEMFNSW